MADGGSGQESSECVNLLYLATTHMEKNDQVHSPLSHNDTGKNIILNIRQMSWVI